MSGIGIRLTNGRPEVRAYTEDALWRKWRDYSAPSAQNKDESVPEWIMRSRNELERCPRHRTRTVASSPNTTSPNLRPRPTPSIKLGMITTFYKLVFKTPKDIMLHMDKVIGDREWETRWMVPHEKRLASSTYLIDEPGLVEKSVKEAVKLKEEGNKLFRRKQYHKAIAKYINANIKLMPWDTAVISLERNHSSGFADADISVMFNIGLAATRLLEAMPKENQTRGNPEAALLYSMTACAADYVVSSPIHRPRDDGQGDDALRGMKRDLTAGMLVFDDYDGTLKARLAAVNKLDGVPYQTSGKLREAWDLGTKFDKPLWQWDHLDKMGANNAE